MLSVWSKVSERYGKKAVYFMGMSLWIIAQAGLFFLQPGQVVQMYLLAVMAGVGFCIAYLIPWSMIPVVIELDEFKQEKDAKACFIRLWCCSKNRFGARLVVSRTSIRKSWISRHNSGTGCASTAGFCTVRH